MLVKNIMEKNVNTAIVNVTAMSKNMVICMDFVAVLPVNMTQRSVKHVNRIYFSSTSNLGYYWNLQHRRF